MSVANNVPGSAVGCGKGKTIIVGPVAKATSPQVMRGEV